MISIGLARNRELFKVAIWVHFASFAYSVSAKELQYPVVGYIAAALSFFIIIKGGKLRIFYLIASTYLMTAQYSSRTAEIASLTLYFSSFVILLLPSLKRLTLKLWPRENKELVDPKPSNFYSSYAWRRLRLKVFEKYGQKCLVPGCNEKATHIDHIRPRSKFPSLALEISNLQPLCAGCNLAKRNDIVVDFTKGASL